MLSAIDTHVIITLQRISLPALRIAIGVVFLWFGALKLLSVSPVAGLIAQAYPFFPQPAFLYVVGALEVIIGLGLIGNIVLRVVLLLLWFQMGGVMMSPLFAPSVFFAHGNPLLLTMEGEFLVKNFVIIAASLAIGGFSVKKRR